jgi:hypothetical protein
MQLNQRLRNLIAAFETERAEVDILKAELQDSIDTLPDRLKNSEEHESLMLSVNTLDLIHTRLNDIVFDLYFLIGEKKDGQ